MLNPKVRQNNLHQYLDENGKLISCTGRLQVTATRGKTRLRGFQTLNFALVRVGGLGLYSRDF